MESILQKQKECWFCKTQYGLHLHEIYFGHSNRRISIKNGFQVYLCGYHHNLGGNGKCVHRCIAMDLALKKACQKKYEETHSRDEFMKLIGKNYLD